MLSINEYIFDFMTITSLTKYCLKLLLSFNTDYTEHFKRILIKDGNFKKDYIMSKLIINNVGYKMYKFINQSIFGGKSLPRAKYFKCKNNKDGLVLADISGHYNYCQMNYSYPCGELSFLNDFDLRRLKTEFNRYKYKFTKYKSFDFNYSKHFKYLPNGFIIDCDIIPNKKDIDPCVPKRIDGILEWSNRNARVVLNDVDIFTLLNSGGKIGKIYSGITFSKRTKCLRDWAIICQDNKKKYKNLAKKEKNPEKKRLYKAYASVNKTQSNAFYGSSLQKNINTIYRCFTEREKFMEFINNNREILWTDYFTDPKAKMSIAKGKKIDNYLTFQSDNPIYLGSYILSYSRFMIHVITNSILGESRYSGIQDHKKFIYSGDTDSLYFNRNLINNENKWLFKNECGHLTDELGEDYGWDSVNHKFSIIKEIVSPAPKLYVLNYTAYKKITFFEKLKQYFMYFVSKTSSSIIMKYIYGNDEDEYSKYKIIKYNNEKYYEIPNKIKIRSKGVPSKNYNILNYIDKEKTESLYDKMNKKMIKLRNKKKYKDYKEYLNDEIKYLDSFKRTKDKLDIELLKNSLIKSVKDKKYKGIMIENPNVMNRCKLRLSNFQKNSGIEMFNITSNTIVLHVNSLPYNGRDYNKDINDEDYEIISLSVPKGYIPTINKNIPTIDKSIIKYNKTIIKLDDNKQFDYYYFIENKENENKENENKENENIKNENKENENKENENKENENIKNENIKNDYNKYKLIQYLKHYYIYDRNHNFENNFISINEFDEYVDNSIRNGKYNIHESDDLDKFFNLIDELHKRKKFTPIAELQNKFSGILLDIDIYQKDNKKYFNNNLIIDVIRHTFDILNDISTFELQYETYAMIQNKPEIIYIEDKKCYKDGYHIIIPSIKCCRDLKNLLIEKLRSYDRLNKLFVDNIKLHEPEKAYDIIDINSSHVPVFLPYALSKPTKTRKPYNIQNIYKFKRIENKNEEFINNISYNQCNELFQNRNIYKEFSINYESLLGIIKKYKFTLLDEYKKIKPSKVINKSLIYNNKEITKDRIDKLLSCLNVDRFNDFGSWIKILMCLKNNSEDNIDLAKKYSKQSNKFDEEDFINRWESIDQDHEKGLTIGSLYYFAKIDNLDKYNELFKK